MLLKKPRLLPPSKKSLRERIINSSQQKLKQRDCLKCLKQIWLVKKIMTLLTQSSLNFWFKTEQKLLRTSRMKLSPTPSQSTSRTRLCKISPKQAENMMKTPSPGLRIKQRASRTKKKVESLLKTPSRRLRTKPRTARSRTQKKSLTKKMLKRPN